MAMSRAEKLAYARGYNAGRRGAFPLNVPPMPDELTLKLALAAKLARDILDGELAVMEPGEEPWASKFGAGIDAVDEALEAVQTWTLSAIGIDPPEVGR